MGPLVGPEEIEESLGLMETLTSSLTSRDEYDRAALENQILQTRLLADVASVNLSDRVDPTSVDRENLPIGIVGTAEESIARGETGTALFDIAGSKFEARVTAVNSVDSNDPVVINAEGNEVRPSSKSSNALSKMAGAGDYGRNALINQDQMGFYETTHLDESTELGSMVLEPGETKKICSTGEVEDGGFLIGSGAYNETDVTYFIKIDGEHTLGGKLSSPLGSVNDPFWYSEKMGGVVPFQESVSYYAEYDESATGEVELTSRLFTQEI